MSDEDELREDLEAMGFTPAQVDRLQTAIERHAHRLFLPYGAELIHRIFLRVDRDSMFGRALARGLGFTNIDSLERAAKSFGVSKQYLHKLQTQVEARLGDYRGQAAAKIHGAFPAVELLQDQSRSRLFER